MKDLDLATMLKNVHDEAVVLERLDALIDKIDSDMRDYERITGNEPIVTISISNLDGVKAWLAGGSGHGLTYTVSSQEGGVIWHE